MSNGINILKQIPGYPILVIDAKDADYNTIGDLTAYNFVGFTKLLVQYVISSTSWDRAGNINIYGSFTKEGTYTSADSTVENASFGVKTDDDTTNTGAGEWYVVENTTPYIKVGWDNTTAGGTGTISVWIMPFNN